MKKRFTIGAAISIAILVVLNAVEPRRPVDDLNVSYGRPFHFWYEGGFVRQRGLLWGGLLADVLFILGAAMCFAYLLGWYERRR